MPELIYAYRAGGRRAGRPHIARRERDGVTPTACGRRLVERQIAERIYDFELPLDLCRSCAKREE